MPPRPLETHHAPASPTYAGPPAAAEESAQDAARDRRDDRPRRRRAGPRHRAGPGGEPGHPGRLHRLRLRPVPGPDPVEDGHLDGVLPVLLGRHLHLRRLPRLPEPAEPHPHLDQHAAGQPVAHPPDHPRPAGLLPAAVPALRRRREDQPDRHQQLRQGPLAGPGRGGQDGQGGAGAGHQPGQHAVVRPRGLRPRQHPLPRVRALLPARLDQADPPARLRLRRLLQRRLRHQDAGRRPGQPARHLRAAGQDLDRPVGRRGEHLHVVHPLRRLAARRPREAVPGRPQRDLGRRHDQHRPQLPRHRQGIAGPGQPHVLRHGQPRPRRLPRTERTPGARRTRSRRCSACSRAAVCTPGRSPACGTTSWSPRSGPGRPRTARRSPTPGRSATGCSCSPPAGRGPRSTATPAAT